MNVKILQNAVTAFRESHDGRYPTQLKVAPEVWTQFRNSPEFPTRHLSFNDYEHKIQLDGMTIVVTSDVAGFELS